MIAVYTEPVLTRYEPFEISHGYYLAILDAAGMAPSPECVAILHAHGALETGHFRACYCNNTGNIKATPHWQGELYTCIKLNEILQRGDVKRPVWFSPEGEHEGGWSTPIVELTRSPVPPGHIATRMRAYKTIADGLHDKIRFLLSPGWRKVFELAQAGDAAGYVRGLHLLKYFTADPAAYELAVTQLARKFLPLARETEQWPISLPVHEEQALEEACIKCARFDWRLVFTPDPNWGAVATDKARDVSEANS